MSFGGFNGTRFGAPIAATTCTPAFSRQHEERIGEVLKNLEGQQPAADRLVTAKTLLGLLDPASDQYGGEDAVNAFLVGGGPSILRYRLDSMDGDWMAEARNGATDMMDRIARLPGLQKTSVNLTAEDSRQNVRFEKVSAIKDVRVTRAVLENHKIAHPELYKGDEPVVCPVCPPGSEELLKQLEAALNSPIGTLNNVVLHQQLKAVIEK